MLDSNLMQSEVETGGHFRPALLRALQYFLVDAHKRLGVQQEGKMRFVSWDDWMS